MPDIAPIRLSDLTSLIQDTLQQRFDRESFWILADVSDHKFYETRKHHYFNLVEKDNVSVELVARVAATAWGDGSRNIDVFQQETGQKFTNGIHVLARVKVSFHSSYGLSLRVLEVDSRFTLGELEKKKQETIRRLLDECPDFIQMVGDHIVTRNKGHQLPLVIQRVAVVSSRQSAGFQDFMHTLHTNSFGYLFKVDEYHAKVQGEANARILVDHLVNVYQSGNNYDVVVIIRGGGAETDFLIFNDYYLNKAIAKFPIPIITGIGHQKDQSIADLMAHTETKTPTKAGEFIVAHNRRFEDRIIEVQKNLIIKAQQIFASQQRGLTQLNSLVVNKTRDYLSRFNNEMVRLNRIITQNSRQTVHERKNELVSLSSQIVTRPRIVVGNKMHELQQIVSNISTFRNQYLKNQKGYLQHYVSLIRMASPEKTLERGFALVKKGDRIITDPNEVEKGEDISIILQKTEIISTIKEKKQHDGTNQL